MEVREPAGERFTAGEAFAAVLYGAVAADGQVAHAEAVVLAFALLRNSMFKGMADAQVRTVLARVRAAHRLRGADGLLAAAAPFVPADLKATAFARCADLTMADGEVSPAEQAYLKKAQQALGVADGEAARILEVVRTLNRA